MNIMNIKTKYMTRNDCYKAGAKLNLKGIMIHCTATPGIMASQWFTRWNKSFKAGEIRRQVCVHSFIDDKEVWQYLPWTMRSWHAGTGWGGDNDTHISIEMCEPPGHTVSGGTVRNYDVAKNAKFFQDTYNNTIDLCVFLCKQYNLSEKDIIDHWEGGQRGTASRSSDVVHWFSLHNKTMNNFREDVRNQLEGEKGMYFSSANHRDHRLVKPVQEAIIYLDYEDAKIEGGAQGIIGPTTTRSINAIRKRLKLPENGRVDLEFVIGMLGLIIEKNQSVKTENNNLKEELKKVKQLLSSEKNKTLKLSTKNENLKVEKETAAIEIKTLKGEKLVLNNKINSKDVEIQELSISLKDKLIKLEGIERLIDALRDENETLEEKENFLYKEIARLKNDKVNLSKTIERLKENLEKEKFSVLKVENENKELKEKIEKLKKENVEKLTSSSFLTLLNAIFLKIIRHKE